MICLYTSIKYYIDALQYKVHCMTFQFSRTIKCGSQ